MTKDLNARELNKFQRLGKDTGIGSGIHMRKSANSVKRASFCWNPQDKNTGKPKKRRKKKIILSEGGKIYRPVLLF